MEYRVLTKTGHMRIEATSRKAAEAIAVRDGHELVTEHEHKWGPLEASRIAGTVHRKCQVDGCPMVNALDEDDDDLEITVRGPAPTELKRVWSNNKRQRHAEVLVDVNGGVRFRYKAYKHQDTYCTFGLWSEVGQMYDAEFKEFFDKWECTAGHVEYDTHPYFCNRIREKKTEEEVKKERAVPIEISVAALRRILKPGTKITSLFTTGPVAGQRIERTVISQSNHQMVLTSARNDRERGYLTWKGVKVLRYENTFTLFNESNSPFVEYELV